MLVYDLPIAPIYPMPAIFLPTNAPELLSLILPYPTAG